MLKKQRVSKLLPPTGRHNLSGGVRNLIGRRSQSDWTAFAIRLDGVRNLIGRRSQSDRAAFGIQW